MGNNSKWTCVGFRWLLSVYVSSWVCMYKVCTHTVAHCMCAKLPVHTYVSSSTATCLCGFRVRFLTYLQHYNSVLSFSCRRYSSCLQCCPGHHCGVGTGYLKYPPTAICFTDTHTKVWPAYFRSRHKRKHSTAWH